MAIYDRGEAAKRAIELVNTALAGGLLKDVVACSFNNPEKAGKESAQYLGGLIRSLTDQIAEL
jgi:hypothetical protein